MSWTRRKAAKRRILTSSESKSLLNVAIYAIMQRLSRKFLWTIFAGMIFTS